MTHRDEPRLAGCKSAALTTVTAAPIFTQWNSYHTLLAQYHVLTTSQQNNTYQDFITLLHHCRMSAS